MIRHADPSLGLASAPIEGEQKIVSGILRSIPRELDERRRHLSELKRKVRATTWEAGYDVQLARAEQLLYQAERVAAGDSPYFARIQGRFVDCKGQEFSEDVRVSGFPNMEEWTLDGRKIVIVSFRAGIADVVRNPSVRMYNSDGQDGASIIPGRVDVLEAIVEDIEIRDGQVIRVAPRYTTIWEDRVRDRLLRVGAVGLDAMADVLDPQQSQALVDPQPRVMIVTGPAGTGKTAVALHRVAILSEATSQILYIVPTRSMIHFMNPALPRLGLDSTRFTIATPWDLLTKLLSVDVVPHLGQDDPWLAKQISEDTDNILACLRRAYERAGARATEQLRLYLEAALAAVRMVMPHNDARLRQFETTIDGKESQVDIIALIQNLGQGVLPGPYQARIRWLFSALREVIQGNPTAEAFLSQEAFEELLRRSTVNWIDIYRSAISEYLSSHDRPQPSRLPVTRAGAALLLLFAAELGAKLPAAARWIVVDEAQSFSPVFYRALQRLANPDVSFVLAGDLYQAVAEQGVIKSWSEAINALKKEGDEPHGRFSTEIALSKIYRLPPRIYDFASRILKYAGLPGEVTHLHPEAGEVEEITAASADEQHILLKQAVETASKDDLYSIVVIAPSLELAKAYMDRWQTQIRDRSSHSPHSDRVKPQLLDGTEAYRGGLAFASLEAMAGLEADVVIVTDVDSIHYPDDEVGAKRLYTACTRARRRLMVISVHEPTRSAILESRVRAAKEAYERALLEIKDSAERRKRAVEAEINAGGTKEQTYQQRTVESRRRNQMLLADALSAFIKDPERYRDGRIRGEREQAIEYYIKAVRRAWVTFQENIRKAEATLPSDWDSVRRTRSKLLPQQ